MRILLVSAYGLPHIGGIEVAVDALARQLSERGHEVTHVTSSAGGDDAAERPERPYRVVRVAAANPLEARAGVPYPLFGPRLLTVLKREIAAADVVHAHGYIYPGTVTAALLAPRGNPPTPLVVTEHVGHVPYDSKLLNAVEAAAIRAMGQRALRAADAVVTYNDRVGEQLEGLEPGLKRETILNGVDHEMFRPPSAAERAELRARLGWDERPRALFVGRPVAKKGFPIAVAAATEAGPAVSLAVAGAERLPAGTPSDVESLGRLSRPRLAEVYRACDVLLIPARGEGFPLAAQESMASGLPLLLANDPGYAPNLAGAGAGVRSIDDPAAFATALMEMVADDAVLEGAKDAAAAHAKSAFSWPRAAAEHEALYEELYAATQSQRLPHSSR